jgi:putative DNA primase/helicase
MSDPEQGTGHAFLRTWRTTVNGLEVHAALRGDTIFVLDELHLIEPKELSSSIYLLAEGLGKGRSNRVCGAAGDNHFRVFILSSGESSTEAHLGEANIRQKAGQTVRLIDINVQPEDGLNGTFKDLHGFEKPSDFSDAIRAATVRDYGHAGPLFVEGLIEFLATGVDLEANQKRTLAKFGELNAQQSRSARILSLVAVAGELATAFGIVPWQDGDALKAAIDVFNIWLSNQKSSAQGVEHAQILGMVQGFILKHSDARFSDIDFVSVGKDPPVVRDRAGYWKEDEKGNRTYIFYPEALREAAKGFAINRITHALKKASALRMGDDGKSSIPTRIPDGTIIRLYHVNPAKLILPGEGVVEGGQNGN